MAVYISAHGMGHAVRAAAVVERLCSLVPARVVVIAPGESTVWPASLAAVTESWQRAPTDTGVVQSDDVTVDFAATAAALERWLSELPAIRERETEQLRSGFDLAIGDVPSAAFEAAERAGIPSVAIANFSWDWIYGELGFGAAAEAAAHGYARASLLLRATPFAPMPAFGRTLDVGLVARAPSRARTATRTLLGTQGSTTLVLVAFQPWSAPSMVFPAARSDRRFLVPRGSPAPARDDVLLLPDGLAFVDAVAAADVVLGKPGYGLIGDIEASGSRFLYVPRRGFPENSVLEQHLSVRAGTLALAAADLASPRWQNELERIEAMPRPDAADFGGAARSARAILELLSIDA